MRCRPQNGSYVVEGRFFPLALFSTRLPPNASDFTNEERNPRQSAACSINGCVGVIRPLEHAVFVDFEELLVA
jgi:hypothetical protein